MSILNAAFLASRPATVATAQELAAVWRGLRRSDILPLHLIAFDLLAGTEVRLSDGPMTDAVLAAAAILGVLPPVRWRGRLLADGGIADNTPVSHAVALGARRIYVLLTQNPGDRGLPRPPRAALAAAVHVVTLLTNASIRRSSSSLSAAAKP